MNRIYLIDDDLTEKELCEIDLISDRDKLDDERTLSLLLIVTSQLGVNYEFVRDKTLYGGYYRNPKNGKCIIIK